MLIPLFAGVTAFIIASLFLPFIIRFSKQQNLLSVPGKRRIHKRITPSLGGVAIFLSFTIACLSWTNDSDSIIIHLLPILLIPFIVGLLDDLIHLKPLAKLIAQTTTSGLLFFIVDFRVESFYGLFSDHYFSPPVSLMATVLIFIIVTNSLNLIDGIDGLAATFSFIAALLFGVWFLFTANFSYATMCFSLCGGILAFLFQNWEPSNIFMGDTGSLFIGTSLSIMMIQFMNDNNTMEPEHHFKFSSSIGTAVCIMILPLVDTARIVIIRLYKNISPFTPDKRHIHHALIRLDFTHKQAVYILALIHICFVFLAVIMRNANDWKVIGVVTTLAILLCYVLNKTLKSYFDLRQAKR